MAKLKLDDIRNMTEAELSQNIASLKEELFKLRWEVQSGRVEKPHRISMAKKKLARIHTIIKEKKRG